MIILVLSLIGIGLIIFSKAFLDDQPYTLEWNAVRFITYIIILFVATILMGMSVKLIGV